MNKLIASIIVTLIVSISLTTELKAKTPIGDSLDSVQTLAKAKLLLIRMDEINATGKSDLTKYEKQSLKRELRLIKGELKELRKGTYLPAGKLVIILMVPFMVFNIIR